MEIPPQQASFEKTFLIAGVGFYVTIKVFHISSFQGGEGIGDYPEQPAIRRAVPGCWEGSVNSRFVFPGPRRGITSWVPRLTVVALGILWDSPGRVPASHRLPRAHARNLLIKHCHTPSSLAGGETVGGPRPKGHQVRQGASFSGGTPRKKSTSSHMGAYLPRRSNRASHDTDRVSRGL